MSLLYSPPMIRRLCAVLRPASGIFASTSSRADKPQKQIRRKGHLQVRRAVLSSGSISLYSRPLKRRTAAHRGATQGIKQPRPTPPGASRGIVICCGPEIARRNGTCRHPTRRIYFFCTPLRLCSLMFLKPLQELIVARGASRDRIDSRFPSLAFPP